MGSLLGVLRRQGCTAVVLVAFEDLRGESAGLAGAVRAALAGHGLDLVEHVCVRAGRVYFPGRGGPAEQSGIALPPTDRVPAVADFVALGSRPAASRAQLAASVVAEPSPVLRRVEAALSRRGSAPPTSRGRPAALAAWGRLLDVGDERWFAHPTPGPAEIARMVHALGDLAVRDLVAAWLSPGTLGQEAFDPRLRRLARRLLPGEGAWHGDSGHSGSAHEGPGRDGAAAAEREGRLTERLCWLARHTPDGHAAPVLTVLACFAWHHGDGALARIALDRALLLAPDYRLALLLERIVELGIRPGVMPEVGPHDPSTGWARVS